jgi:diguanylate cyclase (GGDEF)-like protein/PAS domain S-box-containing protein
VENLQFNSPLIDGCQESGFISNKTLKEERKKLEDQIKESEVFFRTAFNNAAIGMCIYSVDGTFLKVNRALCDLIGYSEEELVNMHYLQITHPDDLNKDIDTLKQLFAGGISNLILENRYMHKNGGVIWAILGVSMVYGADSKPQYLIGQIQDITSRKKMEEELKKAKVEAESLASTDYLTGIMNRRAFMLRFAEELNRARREKYFVSLILIDIDFFKAINDTYGHFAGDTILQQFANALSANIRPYDFLGRHGGEEFIVCLPNTDREQAVIVAERMRRAVEALTIQVDTIDEKIKLTASFGVASPISGFEESIDSLIMQADSAMYKAKSTGRNRVCTSE